MAIAVVPEVAADILAVALQMIRREPRVAVEAHTASLA